MVWKLSTAVKKNIVHTETWSKEGHEFKVSVGWRWGAFFYDQKPNVDLDNDQDDYIDPDADVGLSVVDFELIDGCWTEFDFYDIDDEEQRDKLTELYSNGELEEEGWDCTDSEYKLYGPLELEEV